MDTGTEAKRSLALLTCVRDECCLVAGRRFGKPSKPAVTQELSSFQTVSTVAYAEHTRLSLEVDAPAKCQAVLFAEVNGHFLALVERQHQANAGAAIAMILSTRVDYPWTVYLGEHRWPFLVQVMGQTLFEGEAFGGVDRVILFLMVVTVAFLDERLWAWVWAGGGTIGLHQILYPSVVLYLATLAALLIAEE